MSPMLCFAESDFYVTKNNNFLFCIEIDIKLVKPGVRAQHKGLIKSKVSEVLNIEKPTFQS